MLGCRQSCSARLRAMSRYGWREAGPVTAVSFAQYARLYRMAQKERAGRLCGPLLQRAERCALRVLLPSPEVLRQIDRLIASRLVGDPASLAGAKSFW